MARGKGKGATGLTPYQGSQRCFGYFRCDSCSRLWWSGNSWANAGQECKSCKIMVFPYKQRKLEKREDGEEEEEVDTTKPHPAELCGKCQQLGYPCTQLDRTRSGHGQRRGGYGRRIY